MSTGLDITGNPRKLCVVSDTEAKRALDASVIKDLLKDQGPLLTCMGPYVEEPTASKTAANGLITSNDNEKKPIWKVVRRFYSSRGENLADSLTPELDSGKSEEIKRTTVPELIAATNKELKKTETALHLLINSSCKKDERFNEAEQKIISNDLSMEHLRLLACLKREAFIKQSFDQF